MAGVTSSSSTMTQELVRSPHKQRHQPTMSSALMETHQRAVARMLQGGGRSTGNESMKRQHTHGPSAPRCTWSGPLGSVWGGMEEWLVSTSLHERMSLLTVNDPKRVKVLRNVHSALSGAHASSDTFFQLSGEMGRITAMRRCPTDVPCSFLVRNERIELSVRVCDSEKGVYDTLLIPVRIPLKPAMPASFLQILVEVY